MYFGNKKTDIYHTMCEYNDFLTSNKDFVQKTFQYQFFDDESYIEFYNNKNKVL